ncbi:MAG TPA: glycosyltransferase [Alphaproteobacteria bacterium]|jgi:glycosyltransferase involved in cell wall biosynthesis
MRIVYIAKQLPYGHEEAFVIPEAKALLARGHDLHLAPLEGRGTVRHDDARPLEAVTWSAGLLSPAVLGAALLEALSHPCAVLRAMAPLARSRTPWLLLKNLAAVPKALWLARRCRAAGIEHIHAHWGAVPGTYAMVASAVAGIPFSLTCHRYDIAQNNLLPAKAARASWIRAIDRAGARELSGHIGPGLPQPAVLHMGVEIPPAAARARRADGRPWRFVIAARLVEKKGHRYLFEALAALRAEGRAVVLDVLGEGPLREDLERRVRELGLGDAVTFSGTMPHDRFCAQLQAGAWDAMALPSVVAADGDKEGIPVSLIEAMAGGVPVVATDNGGIPELLEGGAGLVVPERDGTALATAMGRVMDDVPLHAAMTATARARVERDYALAGIVDRLERGFRTGHL